MGDLVNYMEFTNDQLLVDINKYESLKDLTVFMENTSLKRADKVVLSDMTLVHQQNLHWSIQADWGKFFINKT